MIYTKDWAFIHIPKTSGMNFKINAFSVFKEKIIKPYEDSYTGYLYMHNPYSYWEFALRNKWAFSFVRNPFSRAVSLWKFTNEKFLPLFKKKLGHVTFYDYFTGSAFKSSDESLHWNQHMPQCEFLKNKKNKIVVNFFKMENEMHLVENKLNFKFSNTHYNKMDDYDYREIYKNKKNKKLIQEIFEVDFQTFGYDIMNP